MQPPPGPGGQGSAAQGPDGRPIVLSALPPEEQPDAAPANLPPNLRRQEVAFATKEPAGTLIVDTPNTYLYYVLGGGARSVMASASAATASPGPVCRRFRARPSGRTGIRRRR